MKFMKMSVSAVSGQELFVGALLNDAPAVDDDNMMCEAHRAETVGNDKRGASGSRAPKRVDNRALRRSIQTAGGLIENQNARVAQYGAGNGDALLLPAG